MRYILIMLSIDPARWLAGSRPLRHTFVLFMVALLAACAGGGATRVDTAPVAPAPVIELDADLMYGILAAEFAGNAGDLERSVEFYKQAASDTEDFRVAARASYIALYAQQYDDVLDMLERWEDLSTQSDDINRVYAVTYLKQGNAAKSAEYLALQLENSEASDRDKALAVKQFLQKDSGNNPLSRQLLSELNARLPTNLHLKMLESRYAAQLEDFDGAIDLLDKAIAIDPELSDLYLIKAKILAAQGKPEESLAIMSSVLEDQPDNHALRLSYARLLVDEKLYEEASEQFLILLEDQPNDADTLLSLALLSIETDDFGEAEAYLKKLIELDERVDISNYYLGRIAQNDGRSKIAIAYYLKVTSGEYQFDSKLRIASLFARLERPDEGLQKLEVLAEEETAWPNRVRVYLAQGEILRDIKRYEEAVEMYSRALMQNPNDPDLLYARALAAEKVDRLDITEADLKRVISNEPENANALNALGYTLADRTSRLEEAQEYIRRAAELVPDDPAILDSLGWVAYRLGKMEEALKYLRMAFEKLEDPEIAAHFGEVLWVNEQYDEAERVWAIGSEKDAEHPVLVETLERLKK